MRAWGGLRARALGGARKRWSAACWRRLLVGAPAPTNKLRPPNKLLVVHRSPARLGPHGTTLAGSPTYELQPDYGNRDIVLEVSDNYGVVAR